VTRHAVRLLIGHHISDTQTGLRGIPASLLPELLRIRSNGYEFELDVLIACKHRGVDVREYPVRTIYEEGNLSSHFNPLLDSMRIYFVLLRFSGLSLLTAVLDNLIFLSIFGLTGSIVVSQAVARAVALVFNYTAARKAVFLSRERHQVLFPRYLALVISSGAVSYGLIHLLSQQAGLSVPWAKILAETALFIANFAIQRDLIFTSKRGNREGVGAPPPTDWDAYYQSVPPTAKLTRKYTEAALIGAFRKCYGEDAQNLEIVEFGGANSCFLEGILKELRPRRYHVIDSNRYGLDLLRRRLRGNGVVTMECADVLESPASKTADVAFSVGLIEHFDTEGTRQAVGAHFQAVKPGGHLVITFPTPTWLYRVSRFLTEAAGQWKFPDERPILRDEVAKIIWQERGVILFERTLWPLVFTQHLMVIQAPAQASAKSA
jgi:putative flippase GtrA/SAM-dependent methyltransferase